MTSAVHQLLPYSTRRMRRLTDETSSTSCDASSCVAAAKTRRPEVNAPVHSEICALPDERLIAEREVLQPLPSLRLQIGVPSVLRKVDRLSCVRYPSARYSVPTG